jgi:hypothetical protein
MKIALSRAVTFLAGLLALAPFAFADMPQIPVTPETGAALLVRENGRELWIVSGIFVAVTIASLVGLWALRRQRLRDEAAQHVPHDAPA